MNRGVLRLYKFCEVMKIISVFKDSFCKESTGSFLNIIFNKRVKVTGYQIKIDKQQHLEDRIEENHYLQE